MVTFQKATKEQSKLRMAIIGPSGSGKTYSALRIASGLLAEGERMAVVDTERGSAAKYSDAFDFDVLELETFEPERYIEAINSAVDAGYPVLVIDSLSHAWSGKGGVLEFVDKEKQRGGSNGFNAWGKATPKQNQMVDTILSAPIHILVTMRSKMEYVQEKDDRTGKTVVRKVGMQPVQRDGLEYEFDIVGDMTTDHYLSVTKTRMLDLDGLLEEKPGEALGKRIKSWLTEGSVPVRKEKLADVAKELGATPVAQGKPEWWDYYTNQVRDAGLTNNDIAHFLGVDVNEFRGKHIAEWIGDEDAIERIDMLVQNAAATLEPA